MAKKKSGKKPAGGSALGSVYGQAGINAANQFINEYLQPGVAGRVTTDLTNQQDYVNQLKSGLEGYTAPEYQAQREQMQRGLNSSLETAMAQQARAQARGKVYGAAAGAQNQNLIRSAQNQKDQLEQDLMVKNIDERQNRLKSYGEAVGNLNSADLERQKINLGQQNAELSSRINAFLGISGQGLLNSQIKAAQDIQRKGLKYI